MSVCLSDNLSVYVLICSAATWAQHDTAVNLYPVDVARTPFSAMWRNDAIHCNIVSGMVLAHYRFRAILPFFRNRNELPVLCLGQLATFAPLLRSAAPRSLVPLC